MKTPRRSLFAHPCLVLLLGAGASACGRAKSIGDDEAAHDAATVDVVATVASPFPDGGTAADGPSEVGPVFVLPESCATDTEVPPKALVCTGLYADIAAKQLAPGVVPYAPAVPLWSDGAQKARFIGLPAGGVIDNSNPSEWIFPVGTKVWKEFSRGGQRVETRIWQKARTGYWVDATYAWNSDESAATRSGGGDITLVDGSAYHVPTQDECEKCHRGRSEHILGFEQALLGLPGATGLTLDALVNQGLLTHPPARTNLLIGDDGTGAAAPALAWLHVNCGTTCHNENSNSTAYAAGMLLRLDATLLDGRAVNMFDALKTTVGVIVGTPAWSGQTRISPGAPDKSLIYQLISHRGSNVQMPPIASNLVDTADDVLVFDWISRMPAPPPSSSNADAGAPPDTSQDAASLGSPPDSAARGADANTDAGSDGGADADSAAPGTATTTGGVDATVGGLGVDAPGQSSDGPASTGADAAPDGGVSDLAPVDAGDTSADGAIDTNGADLDGGV